MEGDNHSGKHPVRELPESLQRTLKGVPYRYMGGYNTWHVSVTEDDWECIVATLPPDATPRPTVTCLCGSTRFWRDFQRAGLRETMAGKIVLSIGAASGTDDEHFGNLPRDEYERVKATLDDLHLRKIDMADEVLILNVDDYVGESTRRELAYAREHGTRVRWFHLPSVHALPGEGD